MKLTCTFDEFSFNTGEKFYQCIIRNQFIPENEDFEFSGQHQPQKSDIDVQFVEFRNCTCSKVLQGLTKHFPNLKVLSICSSNLKEIIKDDMAEYKNIEKFICDKNEVEFLPGDLFKGFEHLHYIKITNNRFVIIEPNLLDELYNLDYVNFNGNYNICLFYAASTVYNPNALLGEIQIKLYENFLRQDPKKIRDYINESKDPEKTLKTLLKYASDGYKKDEYYKLTFLEACRDLNDLKRNWEIAKIMSSGERLMMKVMEIEESSGKMVKNLEDLDNLEVKLSQQIEELRKELEGKKEDREKLEKNLQKQIESLAEKIQSVISKKD